MNFLRVDGRESSLDWAHERRLLGRLLRCPSNTLNRRANEVRHRRPKRADCIAHFQGANWRARKNISGSSVRPKPLTAHFDQERALRSLLK